MSKNSNQQRLSQFKEWDRWMQSEYPNYRERKKKIKLKRPQYLGGEEGEHYGGGF